jgi:hypothetical protein
MTRLSAAFIRRGLVVADAAADAAPISAPEKAGIAGDADLTCSSQDNIKNSSSQIMKASARNSKVRCTFFDRRHHEVLCDCIALGLSQPSAVFFKSLAGFTTRIVNGLKLDVGGW